MLTSDHLMIDRRIIQEAVTLMNNGHSVDLLAGFSCSQDEQFVFKSINIHRYKFHWTDDRFKVYRKAINVIFRFVPRAISLLSGYRTLKLMGMFFKLNSHQHFIYEKIRARDNIEDYDVIHAHDFPMLKVGVIYAKKYAKKMVYDAHEIYYAQSSRPKILLKQIYLEEKKYIRYVDKTITVNPFIADIMQKEYDIPKPTVLLNAIPTTPLNTDNFLRKEYNISDTSKLLLYQGWISSERGIDNLIRMMPHLSEEYHLVIIGYGDYQVVLENLTNELHVANRVHFHGKVESEDLQTLTSGADLGLIPYRDIDLNHHFCSPNKLFEFIMGQVPFCSNDLPFLRSIADNYQCGITTNFDDPLQAAQSISEFLIKESQESAMKDALIIARKELSWESQEPTLLMLYNGL